jgi:hypothetical protein
MENTSAELLPDIVDRRMIAFNHERGKDGWAVT